MHPNHELPSGTSGYTAAHEQALALRLPTGRAGTLWRSSTAADRASKGTIRFRNAAIDIAVDDPDVLFPTDCGLSLLHVLHHREDVRLTGTALDVGAGSGIYTTALLKAGCERVTALDINAACASVIRRNLIANHLDPSRAIIATADLRDFSTPDRFDLIVANLPHLPDDPSYRRDDGLQTALVAGHDGRGLYDVLLRRLDEFLAPAGVLIIAHSSLTDIGRTHRELADRGYAVSPLGGCELDIPLPGYGKHAPAVRTNLERLRAEGKAEFDGDRFTVEILKISRPAR